MSIVFTGEVPFEELVARYSLGDVFVMSCRTRATDMDLEGLKIVYPEAHTVNLSVVTGDPGGAFETIIDGETGIVCLGRHPVVVVPALAYTLSNPSRAKEMGRSGLAWADKEWH